MPGPKTTISDVYLRQLEQEIYSLFANSVEAEKGKRDPERVRAQALKIREKCRGLEAKIAAFFNADRDNRRRLLETLQHLKALYLGPERKDHPFAKAVEHMQDYQEKQLEYVALERQPKDDMIHAPRQSPTYASPAAMLIFLAAVLAAIGMKFGDGDSKENKGS